MKSDNLFDTKFTFLDGVKIMLLVVTGFSTWNVVDIMTPDGGLSFIREIAALCVVEGAFLGFEFATSDAKSKRQVKFATIGFYCSVAVIVLFAGASGLLEFGGEELLRSPAGNWLGMSWLVRDWVKVGSLVVLVWWIGTLSILYRLYSPADPEQKAAMEKVSINEIVTEEAEQALRTALENTKHIVASSRARAEVKVRYGSELSPADMARLEKEMENALSQKYVLPSAAALQVASELAIDPKQGFVPKASESAGPLPLSDKDGKQ